MFKVIAIGEKNVPMLAAASANIYYKRVFGEDPIKFQADRDTTVGENMEFGMQMGYIMARAAEARGDRGRLSTLSLDDYAEWLDQFDNRLYLEALPEIVSLYNGQDKVSSTEKKEES